MGFKRGFNAIMGLLLLIFLGYVMVVVACYYTDTNLLPEILNYKYTYLNIDNSLLVGSIIYAGCLIIIFTLIGIVTCSCGICSECMADEKTTQSTSTTTPSQPLSQSIHQKYGTNDGYAIIQLTKEVSCNKCNLSGVYYEYNKVYCNGCNGKGRTSSNGQEYICISCNGVGGIHQQTMKQCVH